MSRDNENKKHAPAAVWDPAQYGLFSDERSRAFFELLGRVRLEKPLRIVDLGCGSGELTATLLRRWPDALVEGLDSSAEMISKAREHEVAGRLAFSVGDLAGWEPEHPVDLVVSNAALQWAPGHEDLLVRWLDALTPGGLLAFQVPGNFGAPSHTILRDLCGSPRWRERLGGLLRREPVREPLEYLDLLARHGATVDAWETTYAQILPGSDPVLEWVRGTALRPVLTELGDDSGAFLAEYATLLNAAYPQTPYGTVFPFRRIFVVATRPA